MHCQTCPGQILDEKTLKKSKKASIKAQLEKDKTVSWRSLRELLAGKRELFEGKPRGTG